MAIITAARARTTAFSLPLLLLLLLLLSMLLLEHTHAYRLPLLGKRFRRRRPPTVVLPSIQSFERPNQQLVQAQGWRDSLVSMGNLLIESGAEPTKAQKETIRSIAEALESVPSAPRPALSPNLDGQFKLLFSDSGGVSSGRVGPFGVIAGRVYQDINLQDKSYVNIITCKKPGKQKPWLEARLTATWEVVGDKTWQVFFQDVTVDLFGKRILTQRFNNVMRVWDMTYLDARGDVRIMRGRRPQRKAEDAFLFVLQRDNGVNR